MARGETGTLGAGDETDLPGRVSGEICNTGDEPPVFLVTLIRPTEAMIAATFTP